MAQQVVSRVCRLHADARVFRKLALGHGACRSAARCVDVRRSGAVALPPLADRRCARRARRDRRRNPQSDAATKTQANALRASPRIGHRLSAVSIVAESQPRRPPSASCCGVPGLSASLHPHICIHLNVKLPGAPTIDVREARWSNAPQPVVFDLRFVTPMNRVIAMGRRPFYSCCKPPRSVRERFRTHRR